MPDGWPEPPAQPLLSAHIVAREHVDAAQTSEQHVFGCPAADAKQLAQALLHCGIISLLEDFEIHFFRVIARARARSARTF